MRDMFSYDCGVEEGRQSAISSVLKKPPSRPSQNVFPPTSPSSPITSRAALPKSLFVRDLPVLELEV